MKASGKTVSIVGAGLAGSECAYQLAEMGYKVILFEMRSKTTTPAHKTDRFAELVCSNSFGSQTSYSASGQLKWEANCMDSLILQSAKKATVPAGMSLSVDRDVFSQSVTKTIQNHPNIETRNDIVHKLSDLPRPAVIATGPLTHGDLADDLSEHFGGDFLYFFDAIAPIIDADTINTDVAWKADRFEKGTKDYFNCPLNKEQYYELIETIRQARKIEPKEFEQTPYFEGCMPIEAIIERGDETLRFGPMSPKGLINPNTERRPYAVVQLRQDNKEATAFNMVGFQTRLAYGEQKRIFRMIPGLENAEFLKLGSIHRNLFMNTPKLLSKNLSSKKDPELFFAGQITGVEGYFESTCVGLLIAHFLHDQEEGRPANLPPRASFLGSLLASITDEEKMDHFQPTNINFGAVPTPKGFEKKHGKDFKKRKKDRQVEVAQHELTTWLTLTKGKSPLPQHA